MNDFERNDMFEENDDYGTSSYESDMADVGKRGNKKRAKRTSGKQVEGKLTVAFVAIALAVICLVVLIVLENKLVNAGEKVNVVVATAEVPAGIELNQTNMPNYFAIEERNKDDIPVGVTVYNNGTPMIGKITGRVIHAKEVITNECFYEKSFFADIEDAVELSIDVSAIGKAVGGTLRPGDKIDIKAVIKIGQQSLLAAMNGSEGLLDMGTDTDSLLDMGGTIAPVEGEVVEEEPVANVGTMGSKDAIELSQDGMLSFATDAEVKYGITGEYVSQVIAEDVVVVEVFNSGGETLSAVESAGGNMVATVINVAVPSYLVDAILIADAEGTLTLSRVHEEEVEVKEEAVSTTGTETPADGTTTEATPAPSEVPAQ